jgi:hypothetical protein
LPGASHRSLLRRWSAALWLLAGLTIASAARADGPPSPGDDSTTVGAASPTGLRLFVDGLRLGGYFQLWYRAYESAENGRI